jgi:hypothetical protein
MLNLLIDDTCSLTSICTTRSSTNLHVSNYPFTSKYQTFPRIPSAFKPLHASNCAINNTTGQNRTFAAIYITQEHTLSKKKNCIVNRSIVHSSFPYQNTLISMMMYRKHSLR